MGLLEYFAISMTCLAVALCGLGLIDDWRKWRTRKEAYEEILLSDARKIKISIFNYPWLFQAPYKGMLPVAFFLAIGAVGVKFGWAAVGVLWIFVLIMAAIAIVVIFFTER